MCKTRYNHSLDVVVALSTEGVLQAITESLDKTPRWKLLFITPVKWEGVLRGKVEQEKIELHRYSGLFESPFKPYLICTRTDNGEVVRVTGRCGLSQLGRRLFQFWTGFCVVMCCLILVLQLIGSPAVSTSPMWHAMLAFIGFWAFGVAAATIAGFARRKDCTWLVNRLTAILREAKHVETSGPCRSPT